MACSDDAVIEYRGSAHTLRLVLRTPSGDRIWPLGRVRGIRMHFVVRREGLHSWGITQPGGVFGASAGRASFFAALPEEDLLDDGRAD